jgi:hypothetical protein
MINSTRSSVIPKSAYEARSFWTIIARRLLITLASAVLQYRRV